MQKDPTPLAETLEHTTKDVQGFLGQITHEDYTKKLPILSASTIGQHTRHLIEFFVCIHRQFHGEEDCIDYGARARDIRIESDPAYASEVLEKTVQDICSDCSMWDSAVLARHDNDFPDDKVGSSYGREVLYAIEHCIHHLAIIKIGINSEGMQVDLPENFGVAPSTVKYREKSCAQ